MSSIHAPISGSFAVFRVRLKKNFDIWRWNKVIFLLKLVSFWNRTMTILETGNSIDTCPLATAVTPAAAGLPET